MATPRKRIRMLDTLVSYNACYERYSEFTRSRLPTWVLCGITLLLSCGCHPPREATKEATSDAKRTEATRSTHGFSNRRPVKYLGRLSDYPLFLGEPGQCVPARNVMEYEVNTPLFSDYSFKQRLIRLPDGKPAVYEDNDVLQFPEGTIIAKTFFYPFDMRNSAKGRRLVETRILIRESEGWVGLPYVWNEEQTDAVLSITGASVDVTWVHTDGTQRANSHLVPNLNDCKRCHFNERMAPIGTTARNLNRAFHDEHGERNQLEHWVQSGILVNAPNSDMVPKLAVWDDPQSGPLNDRARAWLEVNCAHCHNPKGPARNSGLHLSIHVTDPYQLGVFKTPVAAGKGTGGRPYGIVPGKPEDSILLYRLETTHVGSMMPEFGRSLVHEESVALIRDWIAAMPAVENR